MKQRRRRILIDRFQTGLIIRIAVYCCVYQLAAWLLFTFFELIDGLFLAMGAEWQFFSNTLVRSVLALLILVPPLTVDAVRFAHRLVGPLYRFRMTIQAMAAGEQVAPIQLRKHDMLTDLKDDFNAMLNYLEQQGYVVLKTPPASNDAATPQLAGSHGSASVDPPA